MNFEASPISWRESGNGPAVVFLHGMPGSRTSWDRQFAALEQSYRCIAWDSPGYGSSAVVPPNSEFATIVGILEGFVRKTLGLSEVHLVGLSLGGMIAMHAAAARPDFVRSLTVLDASPCFGFSGGSDPTQFVRSIEAGLAAVPDMRRYACGLIPALTAPDCPDEIRQEAIAATARATALGVELAARLIARHDIRSRLRLIEIPTLVMTGELDSDTPVAYGRAIAEGIRNATFRVIPKAAHLSNQENAAFVNAEIRRFLAQFDTGGPSGAEPR